MGDSELICFKIVSAAARSALGAGLAPLNDDYYIINFLLLSVPSIH